MTKQPLGLAEVVTDELSESWQRSRGRLSSFLDEVGLEKGTHSQALYILPIHTTDPDGFIRELRKEGGRPEWGDPEKWALLVRSGGIEKRATVLAFPVNKRMQLKGKAQAQYQSLLALFIEVHSRLVLWWLVNAWRGRQLAEGTWQLADSFQFVPAAACARSLVETAASLWVDARTLREIWRKTKEDIAAVGPDVNHRDELMSELNKMLWGAKFNDKVPKLESIYGKIQRTNVLTQIDKLSKASNGSLQEDYQWLCNTVHPSIGGMLAFAAPMQGYKSNSFAFQWVCDLPTVFKPFDVGSGVGHALVDVKARSEHPNANVAAENRSGDMRETTVQDAIARASVLAIQVLSQTLDDALRVIDDVGLTTKAPTMANFPYWRNLERKYGNEGCPCRSGKKAKHCLHRWDDPVPTVVERFQG